MCIGSSGAIRRLVGGGRNILRENNIKKVMCVFRSV